MTALRKRARLVRRRPANAGPGGVVVGGDYQGLGIARSLGRRGIPVCVIDDKPSIARFSRYATPYVRVPDLSDERRTVETVLDIGRRFGLDGWVLYPTREETVAAFSRHRSVLAERFRVPTPSWEAVRWAWDKRNTYQLAEKLGIPTPRTWYPRERGDLAEIDGDFPLVIKPAIKEHFFYATKAKAWRADDRAQLEELFDRAATFCGDGEVMVQELVPGNGHNQLAYCAFFKDGKPLGKMMARRLRQHPPDFGRASTFAETVDLPALEAPSERYLRAMDYYGLVELEYKLDPRDGAHKLLDVNARTWGYHTLGGRAGVDFPAMVFADQLGQPVEPRRATPGVRWIRIVTDVPTALVEISGGRMDWRGYLRSLTRFDEEAVFTRDDPLPGLAELVLLPYLVASKAV